MTVEERVKLIRWLEESHLEFLSAVENLSEAQWRWKPSSERWSVAETAEHIVLTEAALFARVQWTITRSADAGWEEKTTGKTEFIERVMAPRAGRAQAPEALIPRGPITAAQVRERFEQQRIAIVKFAKETNVALKTFTAMHPMPVFGVLNAYQWLIYALLHTIRHNKQIAEVKATPGYPL
jgi:hypothetical protein